MGGGDGDFCKHHVCWRLSEMEPFNSEAEFCDGGGSQKSQIGVKMLLQGANCEFSLRTDKLRKFGIILCESFFFLPPFLPSLCISRAFCFNYFF